MSELSLRFAVFYRNPRTVTVIGFDWRSERDRHGCICIETLVNVGGEGFLKLKRVPTTDSMEKLCPKTIND